MVYSELLSPEINFYTSKKDDQKTFSQEAFPAFSDWVFPVFYSWQIEPPFWVEFVEQKLPVKILPKELEGKILMQISDLHVGNRFDWNFLIESFQKAQQFNPDFVVYTGDFVNHGTSKITKVYKK